MIWSAGQIEKIQSSTLCMIRWSDWYDQLKKMTNWYDLSPWTRSSAHPRFAWVFVKGEIAGWQKCFLRQKYWQQKKCQRHLRYHHFHRHERHYNFYCNFPHLSSQSIWASWSSHMDITLFIVIVIIISHHPYHDHDHQARAYEHHGRPTSTSPSYNHHCDYLDQYPHQPHPHHDHDQAHDHNFNVK